MRVNYWMALLIAGTLFSVHGLIAAPKNKSTLADFIVPHLDINKEEANKTLKKIIVYNKQLTFKPYIYGHNPSIIPYKDGYLVSFRHNPSQIDPWLSHICVVRLNRSLERISYPQVIPTPKANRAVPSQTQDARLVTYKNEIYMVYNDNVEVSHPQADDRRDMYLAKLVLNNNRFYLDEPLLLTHEMKYHSDRFNKNWVPFVWNNQLLLAFTISPHEVVGPVADSGICNLFSVADSQIPWKWGDIRGGTPALMVDGEYLAFFHSSLYIDSPLEPGKLMKRYYLGAYTFSSSPPFQLTKISPYPLVHKDFYEGLSDGGMQVIFPGGFVDEGSKLILAYGRNDREIWIAKIDKAKLMEFLKPVQ